MDIASIKALLTMLLITTAYLFPIVLLIVGFIKSKFNTTGNTTFIISLVISLLIAVGYGLLSTLIYWQIIILYIMVAIASNGGYTVMQNIINKKNP